MSDYPKAFKTEVRKSRKQHICCECRKVIEKGELYQYSSGIWGCEPQSYKQCINCHEIMEAAAKTVDSEYELVCFGDLRDWLEGFVSVDFKGKEWLIGMSEHIDVPAEKLNKLIRLDLMQQ